MADVYDPCAEALKLRDAIRNAITEGRVTQVQFASGSGSSRMVTRTHAKIDEMRMELTRLEQECAALTPGAIPKRFAFRSGGM